MSIKRWTVCLVRGHRWAKISYPGSEGSGYFARCRFCDYENHNLYSVRPTGSGL